MMTNILASPQAMENASSELRKRSEEWISEAEKISSEKQREEMIQCGRIIKEYSELLEKVCSEYRECESRISSASGGIL